MASCRVLIITVSLSAMLLLSGCPGRSASNGAPQSSQASKAEGPKVEAGTTDIVVDKVEVGAEFRQILNLDPPYSPPVVRPTKKEDHFVFVYVTAEFPKANSWNLKEFYLRDDSRGEHQVVAFDIGDVLNHGLIYAFESGALALADAERSKKGIADRLEDRSGRLKPEAGRVTFLGEWPGGKGKLVLAFEVPTQAKELTLLRKN